MIETALILIFTGPWLVYLFVPVPDQLAEYRNYVMCAGFALLASLLPWPFWFFAGVLGATMTPVHALAWTGFTAMWTRAKECTSGDRSRAYQELGAWKKIEGNNAEAEPLFREAIRLNPRLAPAMENLAVVLLQTGREEEGLRVLETMVERCPFHASGWLSLGLVYEQRQRFVEAQRCFEQAVMNHKDVPTAANHLGLHAYKEQRFDDALRWFEKARKYHPDHPDFIYNQFTTLDALDRPEESKALRQKLKGPIPLTTEMIRPANLPQGVPC